MSPSLRQLEYVVAIADSGSFSDAARRCGVSQPGLSSQVSKLEHTLGVRLFERGARGVILTSAGEGVVARARLVMSQVDDLVTTAATLTDPLSGTLRLGVIPTIAPYLLPEVMPVIRARFPALRLLIREERTARLTSMVREAELDLALVALESDLSDLMTLPLFKDRFVLAVARNHRLAGRKRVRPSELEGEEVLLLDDGHCLRDQTAVICDAAGACEVGDLRATSLSTLAHMVESGVGVTMLPEMAVTDDRSFGRGLSLVPFAKPEPGRTVALAWRPSSPHRERYEAFAGALVT